MANLLVDWLNGFELSSEVSDLGKDLRNGYLLAELFSSERAYESRTPFPLLEDLKDYNACTTLESSLKNFARLQDYLKHSCHLVLADDLVKDVMLQKRGNSNSNQIVLQPEILLSLSLQVLRPSLCSKSSAFFNPSLRRRRLKWKSKKW